MGSRKFGHWIAAGLAAGAALALGAAPAQAQVDPFVQASRNCARGDLALDAQLKNCMIVVNAQGLEPADMAVAYVNLGLVYHQQQNEDAALVAYNKALTYQPTLWQALLDRAFLYLNRGDLDHAIVDYNALAATDPNGGVLELQDGGHYRPVVNGEVHNYDSSERDNAVRNNAIAKLRDAVAQVLYMRGAAKHRASQAADGDADIATAEKLQPGVTARMTAAQASKP